MNKIIVIYKSKYGATKQYAEWIAEALDAELREAKAVKPESLGAYDVVIYGGGLYAGGIAGVKLVTQNTLKNIVVFTVGLADPAVTDYSEIRQKAFTPELASKVKLFHLRGGVDYKRLGFVHKLMMRMMKNMIQKKSESERTPDDKEFLNTYGAQVDFASKDSIAPLVAFVQTL